MWPRDCREKGVDDESLRNSFCFPVGLAIAEVHGKIIRGRNHSKITRSGSSPITRSLRFLAVIISAIRDSRALRWSKLGPRWAMLWEIAEEILDLRLLRAIRKLIAFRPLSVAVVWTRIHQKWNQSDNSPNRGSLSLRFKSISRLVKSQSVDCATNQVGLVKLSIEDQLDWVNSEILKCDIPSITRHCFDYSDGVLIENDWLFQLSFAADEYQRLVVSATALERFVRQNLIGDLRSNENRKKRSLEHHRRCFFVNWFKYLWAFLDEARTESATQSTAECE